MRFVHGIRISLHPPEQKGGFFHVICENEEYDGVYSYFYFMSVIEEFRSFAMRGNVVDLAVGVVIGGAFGKIVDSLVKDIIMPPLGLVLGNVDFSNLFFVLKEGGAAGPYTSVDAATKAGAITLNLGFFLNALISFLIVAFAIFVVVKMMNSMRKKETEHPTAPALPAPQEKLLAEIRDILKGQKA